MYTSSAPHESWWFVKKIAGRGTEPRSTRLAPRRWVDTRHIYVPYILIVFIYILIYLLSYCTILYILYNIHTYYHYYYSLYMIITIILYIYILICICTCALSLYLWPMLVAFHKKPPRNDSDGSLYSYGQTPRWSMGVYLSNTLW